MKYYFQEWVCHGVVTNIIRYLISELVAPSLVPRPSSRVVDPLPKKLSEREAW